MRGIVICGTDDHRSCTRQYGFRIHPAGLLPFEIMHLTGIPVLDPFWIEVRFRKGLEGSHSDQIETERPTVLLEVRGIHEKVATPPQSGSLERGSRLNATALTFSTRRHLLEAEHFFDGTC